MILRPLIGSLSPAILLISLMISVSISYAVLPPQYQNKNDLDAIVRFIYQNETILSTLERIDLKTLNVHYGNGCIASFGRKVEQKPLGWVGPASPLEFKSSTCSLD